MVGLKWQVVFFRQQRIRKKKPSFSLFPLPLFSLFSSSPFSRSTQANSIIRHRAAPVRSAPSSPLRSAPSFASLGVLGDVLRSVRHNAALSYAIPLVNSQSVLVYCTLAFTARPIRA